MPVRLATRSATSTARSSDSASSPSRGNSAMPIEASSDGPAGGLGDDVGQHPAGDLLGVGAGEDDRELVAAEASDDAAVPGRPRQVLDHPPQGGVAGGVAGGLVDGAEVVEVEQEDRAVAAAGQEGVERPAERGPVERPGEAVVVGVVARLVEHRPQLLGDAPAHQQQRDRRQADAAP